jgi:hypothetical protein
MLRYITGKILPLLLKKKNVMMWKRFWLGIASSGRLCEDCNGTSVFIKCGEFIDKTCDYHLLKKDSAAKRSYI